MFLPHNDIFPRVLLSSPHIYISSRSLSSAIYLSLPIFSIFPSPISILPISLSLSLSLSLCFSISVPDVTVIHDFSFTVNTLI